MEEKRKDTYIWPELAVSNMEAAQQMKKPVYLYGDSGCGKTVFVKRYLLTRGSDDDRYVYLQAEELTSRRLEKIAGDREVTVLVLDDLQELSDMEEAEEIKARICRILTQGRLWVILISRGRMPGWLLEVQMEINIKVISEKEKRITAYHEAGHAILFHLLPDVGPVYTVSIIPTGMGAAGYTMPVPENDNVFETKGRMIQEIKVGMGGRIAEELIFDDVTTGASQDIKQVTDTARSMITKFGMSDRLGFINYEENTDEVFLGRDLGHSRSFSEEVASIIDKEVKKLVDDCYTDAKRILTENMDVLHSCANLLLEKERISREEFEALFKNDKAAEENL